VCSSDLVVITSAVAVPRKIYRHFAQYLVEKGARCVYTYDFRGLMGQNIPNERLASISMIDWATKDFPCLINNARMENPDCDLVGVGHSFGGQVLGLGDNYRNFSRYLGIACGSGYLKHTNEPNILWIKMNIVGRLAMKIFGKIPSGYGLGTGVPVGVFNDWRRWCNSPEYMMCDPAIAALAHFDEIRLPLRFVGFSDDPWATKKAVTHLVDWYENAEKSVDWLDCALLGKKLGHMGFFKPQNQDLWASQADWLLQ